MRGGIRTSVYSLHLSVEEIKGFEKLPDGALGEYLIESATLHEYRIHIAEAHLRNLKSERDVLAMRTDDFKEPSSFLTLSPPGWLLGRILFKCL